MSVASAVAELDLSIWGALDAPVDQLWRRSPVIWIPTERCAGYLGIFSLCSALRLSSVGHIQIEDVGLVDDICHVFAFRAVRTGHVFTHEHAGLLPRNGYGMLEHMTIPLMGGLGLVVVVAYMLWVRRYFVAGRVPQEVA